VKLWGSLTSACLFCTLAGFGAQTATAAGLGVVTIDRAQLIDVQAAPRVEPRPISLPLHWDVSQRNSGRVDLLLPFTLNERTVPAGVPYTLFIARLGNAYEIRLNDVLLQTAGVLDRAGDRWSAKQPVTLNFPSELLRADRNELRIRLRADFGRRGGLSEVMVGPMREVIPWAEQQERWRVWLPQAASVFSLLVAAFCALLWWQHRDPLYAWAGLGEALWAIVVADAVVEMAPLPWPAWGYALVLLRTLWLGALYMVTQQVFGPGPRLERRALLVVLLSVPIASIAAALLQSATPLRLAHLSVALIWLLVVMRLAAHAVRSPTSDRALLLLALCACLVAGVRDIIAARWDAALYDESAWVKFIAPLIGAVVIWIVSTRFRRASTEVVTLNATLEQRIHDKEHELRESFARLSAAERSRAVVAERERILRDMHDGVGANLTTAMRQLESGHTKPGDVVAMLRESLDQLKLSIDAINIPRGDVNALLASLRYRLQPRIEGAGLVLLWDVDPLVPWDARPDGAMHHLQFLLLEAFSNALQHANATSLRLGAHVDAGAIHITLRDDGCGIGDASATGLKTMRERAAIIGANLVVEPVTPGTRVVVRLPNRG
jgi:signal transduction histidine kinase